MRALLACTDAGLLACADAGLLACADVGPVRDRPGWNGVTPRR